MDISTIILIIIAIVVVWFIFAYNKFVRLVIWTKEAWSDIEVQMKRRYDLIPNLVNTVKGYAVHESKTFEEVTRARTVAMSAESIEDRGKAENMLSGALKSLFAVAESYPELKANENFLELQRELSDTENKIQAARRFYNTNVRDLNIATEIFPSNIIASIFKFSKKEFFNLEGEEIVREPIKVQF
ncbi:MAG: LemA family protein [Candidatus Zambryskibacteria bacterium]|nr:LemA family protein [Candidatus Zambryskibacteria bacterium]